MAEAFCDAFPHIEQLRFLKTGSEACSAAVRIARAFTDRPFIISEGYHGWHDEFTSVTPPAHGVPDCAWRIFKLGQLLSECEDTLNELAAIIIEPIITDMSEERLKELRRLRSLCTKFNALLIFDETITGLRFPGMSVAKHTGITPDLTVMGKAIGGGYPLALVGGRRDVMSADYFVSSTFAGDCIALAAAKAVLEVIRDRTVLDRLEVQAKAFQFKFNEINSVLASLEGYGTRCAFKFKDDLTKALFLQECCKAGVLFGPSFFYGTTHSEHDEFTLSVCKSVLNKISNNEAVLEGKLPVQPFAEKVRGQRAE